MASEEFHALQAAMAQRPVPPPPASIVEHRQRIDDAMAQMPLAEGTEAIEHDVDGVFVIECRPIDHAADAPVIVYAHGGGFRIASALAYRSYGSHLARATDARVMLVDYRLAPEHVFPAALDDCVAVHRWVLASGVPASRVVVMGDSAGGGLAASLVLHTLAEGPTPAAAICCSPWVDLTVSAATYDTRAEADRLFSRTQAEEAAPAYLGTTMPDHPLVSPIFGDWRGAPPMLIQVGRDALDRITERRVNSTTIARYVYASDSDTPVATLDATGNLLERTIALPGGVTVTIRSAGNVWSYPNLHGDIAATATQTGTKIGTTATFDPNGNQTTGTTTDNSTGNFDNRWLGQYQRPTETEPGLEPIIEMGARQYSPRLGRFLETDPVTGGSANAYTYTFGDPNNTSDITGRCGARVGHLGVFAMFAYLLGYLDSPCFMGYEATWVRINGLYFKANPSGSCSTPGMDINSMEPVFNFKNACSVHDYGYDLMRFYNEAGWSRVAADTAFNLLMRMSCRGRIFESLCNRVADVYDLGVKSNSFWQWWGVP